MQPTLAAPTETNRAQAAAPLPSPVPLPETPASDAPTKDRPAKEERVKIPLPLLEEFQTEARNHFVLIPDMTFALGIAGKIVAERWERKDGNFTRKPDPYEIYSPSAAPPAESPDVAAARARWDEAKRAGDPDRMTRTANDLLRATEAEQSRHPSQSATEHRSTSDILAPKSAEAADPLTIAGVQVASRVADAAAKAVAPHDANPDEQRPSFEHAVISPDRAASAQTNAEGFEPVAWIEPDGRLTGLRIERPDAPRWTAPQRTAAQAIESRINAIGDAIQRYGTPEQREAWRRIKRLVLQNTPLSEGGPAQNEGETFRVDLNMMGAPADPKHPQAAPLPPDPNFVMFMLAHEIFHGTASDRAAEREAVAMQGGKRQTGPRQIGTPEWSAEVRHDKIVYDFLVRTGLLGSPPPPIERIAPYYYEHLQNPRVPVHRFRTPGYDEPID